MKNNLSLQSFFAQFSRSDRILVFVVITVTLILTCLPILVGLLVAGQEYTYLSISPLAPADTNVYYSFIKQVAQGEVFIQNLHTSELQSGSIFHPLWLVLGWFSGLTDLPIPLVFHIARLVLGAVFLLFVYYFLSLLFKEPRRRNLAFVLIALSSGVGSFFSLGLSLADPLAIMLLLPTDQWVSESNTFLTLFHSPLFILAQLLLLVIFWAFVIEDRIKSFSLVAASAFLLGLIHPYDLLSLGAILPAFFIVRLLRDPKFQPSDGQRVLRRIALVGLYCLPAVVYYFAVTRIEPAVGLWAQQNITTSPPIHNYLLGYGFLWVFAVVGWAFVRRTRDRTWLFILTWVVVSALLIYVPIQINRRLTNGFHIPLAILATVGIDLLWQWIREKYQKREIVRTVILAAVGWVLAIGLFFSTAVVVARAIYYERDPEDSIYYAPRGITRAMDWLGQNAPPNSVVLSQTFNGNIIPARTGLRVFVGHGHQTVHYEEKKQLANQFFADDQDQGKADFLRQAGIDYIFFSYIEDRLGDFNPSTKPYLELVYSQSEVEIYQVR